MRLRRRLLFASLAVAAVASVGIGYAVSEHHSGAPGDNAVVIDANHPLDGAPLDTNATLRGRELPPADLLTATGMTVSTADLLGQPLVINVWSSTCTACAKELPDFVAAHRELGDQVRFVGIDPYYSNKTETAFAKAHGVDYELLFDGDGRFTTPAGIVSQPVTLFVRADGTIVEQTGQIDLATIRSIVATKLLS